MRLRGSLLDSSALLSVLVAVEKIGPMVYMRWSPEAVAVVQCADGGAGEQVFAELPSVSLFSQLRIQSQASNRIFMQLRASDLVRALRAGTRRDDPMAVRLRKVRGSPFLSVEVKGDGIEVVQDVPVAIVTQDSYDKTCFEPELEEPQVKVHMPPLRVLHSVVDRMRSLNDEARVVITTAGEFTISTRTPEASVRTFFRDLALPGGEGEAPDEVVSRMDLRRLARVLHCRGLNFSHAIGAAVRDTAFIVYVMLRPGATSMQGEAAEAAGTVAYYIPVLADEM